MAQITLYGISNCDTVRKAKKWLESQDLTYEFVDFRKDGIDTEQVTRWVDNAGLERVLNKRGTTWRKLSEDEQANAADRSSAIKMLTAQPTLIKRPILEYKNDVTVGFNAAVYQDLF